MSPLITILWSYLYNTYNICHWWYHWHFYWYRQR